MYSLDLILFVKVKCYSKDYFSCYIKEFRYFKIYFFLIMQQIKREKKSLPLVTISVSKKYFTFYLHFNFRIIEKKYIVCVTTNSKRLLNNIEIIAVYMERSSPLSSLPLSLLSSLPICKVPASEREYYRVRERSEGE